MMDPAGPYDLSTELGRIAAIADGATIRATCLGQQREVRVNRLDGKVLERVRSSESSSWGPWEQGNRFSVKGNRLRWEVSDGRS